MNTQILMVAMLSLPLALPVVQRNAFGAETGPPHLEKAGSATQLIVDGQPLLMLSGELHNSSSSSLDYLQPIWPRLVALNLNTVIASLSWELVESEEGRFDFSLADGIIEQARRHNLKLVFIWFATWKNGDGAYVPAWVKTNRGRFPRCQHRPGIDTTQLFVMAGANYSIRFASPQDKPGNTAWLSIDEVVPPNLARSSLSARKTGPFPGVNMVLGRRLNGDEASYRVNLGPTPRVLLGRVYRFQ